MYPSKKRARVFSTDYNCNECIRSFNTYRQLQNHKRIHKIRTTFSNNSYSSTEESYSRIDEDYIGNYIGLL